ncbi:NCS2 family permease [Halomarina litorea]|uniref:NCS2 family permease n=1 Tax=Halomarina litorea TaxID=2961595 RepID=UPI0020C3F0F9|nr:NCS2 family permease [Halomarina sp. BCD28]
MASDSNAGSRVASFFEFDRHGTDARTEVVAGITTFLTMSYIIVVNPAILSEAISIQGYSEGETFQMLAIATILAAAIGSVVMALYANRPFGLAPGMGLNAYFAFTVVISLGIPWQTALAAVFVEGVIFMAMSSVGARRYIIEFFPEPVKFAVGAGIGLFLLLLGLIETNIAVADEATLVSLGNVASDPVALLALAGLAFTIVLYAKGVTGSIIIGILATAAAGWGLTLAGVVGGGVLTPGGLPPVQYDITPLVGAFVGGFGTIEPIPFVIVVFTFFFVDFFDTAGTLIGVSQFGNFLDEDGNLPEMEKPLMADAVATTCGAMVGTTTVTTYVESSTGVEEGGRTGLTALVVAVLFLASLVAVPVVAAIPTYASYLGLILVGLIMLQGVTDLKWQRSEWLIPGGLTIVMMPLTASIANGIAAGIISYPLVKSAQGDYDEVHALQWALAGSFALYFYVTAGGVMS